MAHEQKWWNEEAETFTPQLEKECKQRIIYARRKQKACIKGV